MRTIIYNEDTAPGAGAITSWEGDCSPQLLPRTPRRTRTEVIMITQAALCLRLLNYAYILPLAPVLPLLKPKAHVSTPKMGWNVYSASSCRAPVLHSKPHSPLLALSGVTGVNSLTWHVETPGVGPLARKINVSLMEKEEKKWSKQKEDWRILLLVVRQKNR
jgi:hypothetical protein